MQKYIFIRWTDVAFSALLFEEQTPQMSSSSEIIKGEPKGKTRRDSLSGRVMIGWGVILWDWKRVDLG